MLKGIPSLLSPELLKILMEMGHGDEIVIGEVLEAILQLMPLDPYVEQPLALMDLSGGDTEIPPIWQVYADTAARYEPDHHAFEKMERFAFYERAKKAYAIATGESAIYANIILKKGVVK